MLSSPDLVSWTPVGDALPTVGRWTQTGKTWPPEVIEIRDGHYPGGPEEGRDLSRAAPEERHRPEPDSWVRLR